MKKVVVKIKPEVKNRITGKVLNFGQLNYSMENIFKEHEMRLSALIEHYGLEHVPDYVLTNRVPHYLFTESGIVSDFVYNLNPEDLEVSEVFVLPELETVYEIFHPDGFNAIVHDLEDARNAVVRMIDHCDAAAEDKARWRYRARRSKWGCTIKDSRGETFGYRKHEAYRVPRIVIDALLAMESGTFEDAAEVYPEFRDGKEYLEFIERHTGREFGEQDVLTDESYASAGIGYLVTDS